MYSILSWTEILKIIKETVSTPFNEYSNYTYSSASFNW